MPRTHQLRAAPLAHLLDGMRQALIFGHGPDAIWPDIRNLLLWLAVGLLVAPANVPLGACRLRAG